jgi:hypothetical protein
MWDKFAEIENAFWWILFLIAVIGGCISWIVSKAKEIKRQMEYEKNIPDDHELIPTETLFRKL